MAKGFAKSFYNSIAWQKARNTYIKERVGIDGGMCERCKKDLGYIVHHKIKLTEENIDKPEVSLNYNNFEYLCKACHDEVHCIDIHGERKKKQRCYFDEQGNPREK